MRGPAAKKYPKRQHGQLTIPDMKRNLVVVSLISFVMLLSQTQSGLPQAQSPTQNQAGNQQPANPQEGKTEAEEGIKHLLVSQVKAWNQGDLQGFMSGYWHSPELTFFSGATVSSGWQAALQRYQNRYQGTGKEMGRLEFQDLNIDLLGPRAAVVTGKWQLTMSDGKTPHGLFTLILKKLQDGWRIVHDHTSSAEEK